MFGSILKRVAALLLVLPATSAAQAAQSAARSNAMAVPGTQVRVMRQMNGWRRQETSGRLVRLRGDTAVVQVNFDSIATIPLRGDLEMEVRTGHTSHVLRGAGIGLAVGGAVGTMVGAAAYRKCTSTEMFGCIADFGIGFSMLGGALLVGAGGAVIGAFIGAAHGTDSWTPVRRASALHAGIAPAPGGGVRISAGFSF